MSNTKTRVAVVEDEGLYRDLMCSALQLLPDFELVGAFASEAEAAEALPALAPQLVLLDIDLGTGGSGVRLGEGLQAKLPSLRVVLLSNHREAEYLNGFWGQEAKGWSFLHKKSVGQVKALHGALSAAASGLVVLDAEVAHSLRQGLKQMQHPRSQAILDLLAKGLSNAAIAARLHLSEKSVQNQLNQLYRELNIDTSDPKAHARVRAVRAHLYGETPHQLP